MNSGNNNMEQWLQQSAEMGNAAFSEADWQHMQQLLQPKKKRRFIVFWWLLGLLIGGSLLAYLLMDKKDNEEQAKSKPSAKSKEQLITKEKNNNGRDSSMAFSNGTNSHQTTDEKRNGSIPSIKEISRSNANKQLDLELAIVKTKSNQKRSPQKATAKKQSSFAIKMQQQNIKGANCFSTSTSVAVTKDSNQYFSAKAEEYYKFNQGELAKILLNLSANSIKIADSITKLDLPKDSTTTKKKNQTIKNEWSFAIGYYTGNIPVKSNGINTKLAYSIKLGSFFLQPSFGASTFNPNEEQVHQQVTIRPPSGTTITEVKTINTYFTPATGFVLHPSVSIGWQIKKMKLYTGFQQNIVVNGSNHTNRTILDSAYYPIMPSGLVATKAYDASVFNGSKSLSMHIGVKYNMGKRWFANIECSQMLDQLTAEGIIDDKQKRMAFLFLLGLRF